MAPVCFHSTLTDLGSAFVLTAQRIRGFFFGSVWFMTQTGYAGSQTAGEINFVCRQIHMGRKNYVCIDKSINLTQPEMLQGLKASLAMFIKAKKVRLACWLQRWQLTSTGKAISEQRLPKGQSWGCWVAVWMSGSLPLALCSNSGWGFLAWEWWGLEGGTEPHTCQMICHYRGVSTQLSPPNHPSYPLSHPPIHPPNSTPVLQKHPLHSSGSSGFTHSSATPSAPPSYTLPREEKHPRETQHTERIVWMWNVCSCPCVCEYMFI